MPNRRIPEEEKRALRELGENPKIVEWFDRVKKDGTGSTGTLGLYLHDIRDFLAFAKMTPEEILRIAGDKLREDQQTGLQKESWAEKLTTSFFNVQCQKGARTSAKRKYGAVRSFFRAHGLLFTGKTPDATTQTAPLRVYEDELTKLWNSATLQEKQVLSALRSTGWRPSELVDTEGRDGKVRKGPTYGDIRKDLERGEKRLYFERVSKKESIWVGTFFSLEATNTLKLALDQRKNAGETFTDETRLFPYKEPQLAQYVRQAAERVGLKITPKTFRKLFRTKCESIIGKDAVYRMAGWTIPGVGKVYNLPPREESLSRFLQIERLVTFDQGSKEQFEHRLKRQEALTRIQTKILAGEQLDEQDRRDMQLYGIQLRQKSTREPKHTDGGQSYLEQRLVTEEELPSLLSQGWTATLVLRNGKVVVTR